MLKPVFIFWFEKLASFIHWFTLLAHIGFELWLGLLSRCQVSGVRNEVKWMVWYPYQSQRHILVCQAKPQ